MRAVEHCLKFRCLDDIVHQFNLVLSGSTLRRSLKRYYIKFYASKKATALTRVVRRKQNLAVMVRRKQDCTRVLFSDKFSDEAVLQTSAIQTA